MNGLHGGFSTGFAIEPCGEHIRQKQPALFAIEGSGGRGGSMAHGDGSKHLATAYQFVIDGADLVQDLAETMVVGETLAGLALIVLWDVIHLRLAAIVTDRQVVLGPMTRTVGALASWLAARFVALDERAPQQTIEGWHVAQ